MKKYINKTLFVKIDRPLGSYHPKYNYKYTVNYGFIPNTISGDGEELDAYVLGVNISICDFIGKCIAVIHRLDDNDDKLIVVPENMEFSDEEIDNMINFQEKWFKHTIIRE